MRIKSTKGIVFKSIKYSETSLVLDIYTYDFGLKSFIISGVRKSKSKIGASLFQIMNLVEIEFYNNDSQNLSRIKEGRLYCKYSLLPFDVVHASLGTFLMELTRNAVKEHEANHELFKFIEQWFVMLDSGQVKLKYFHILYLIELTRFIGFYPHNNYSVEKPFFDLLEGNFVSDISVSNHVLGIEESSVFNKIFSTPVRGLIDGSINLDVTVVERDRIIDNLIKYYAIHLDQMHPIKSLEVLRTIME